MKTSFICQQCAYSSPKWIGKCPGCESWNSFQEEIQEKKKTAGIKRQMVIHSMPISQIKSSVERIKTNIAEFDRVLGGGIIQGNVILFAGEPGIGKSTLTLQLCGQLALQQKKILYVSGEESVEQISLRAKRLNTVTENLSLLNQTDFDIIMTTIEQEKPDFIIIDSIQVISSENQPGMKGSIGQVRYCTEQLMNYAKVNGTPTILIGHVTKEGNLAGPRVLEHLVDTVLFFEGDRYHDLRLLRNLKHRFGPTDEVGIFEMREKGLQEIQNPSAAFLEERKKNMIGSCISCTMEGSRPLLIEIQALTNTTPFGYPKRAASGFDLNRLQLLIAVLQQHARLNLSADDIYVNIVGGISVKDPAIDIAVCLAIASSKKKIALSKNLMAMGEVGLTGEIRKVPQLEKRTKEGKKFGLDIIQCKNMDISQAIHNLAINS